MSSDTDTEIAARQVLNNKIKTDRFWRDYTAMDAAAVFGPTVMLITIARLLSGRFGLPDLLGPAYLVGIGVLLVWGTIIYVLPSWETPMDFVKYTYDFIMTPDTYEHVEHNYDSAREQKHESPAKWWHTETRTQDLHRIDEFPLGGDVVRRRDGYLVGAIEVSSSNMTLAGRDKWSQNVDIFEDFLENSLDFDFTIYSPTRRFKKGEYVERHRDRLSDEDVRTNSVLEAVCADYSDWLDVKLGGSSTSTRRNFVLVAVGKHEVRYLEDEETLTKNLSNIPVLGRLTKRFDDEADVDDDTLRDRQLVEVDRRLTSIEQSCISELAGCSASRVTDGGLAELIYSHWEGEEFEGDMDELLRRYPVVSTADIQNADSEETNTAATETTA